MISRVPDGLSRLGTQLSKIFNKSTVYTDFYRKVILWSCVYISGYKDGRRDFWRDYTAWPDAGIGVRSICSHTVPTVRPNAGIDVVCSVCILSDQMQFLAFQSVDANWSHRFSVSLARFRYRCSYIKIRTSVKVIKLQLFSSNSILFYYSTMWDYAHIVVFSGGESYSHSDPHTSLWQSCVSAPR